MHVFPFRVSPESAEKEGVKKVQGLSKLKVPFYSFNVHMCINGNTRGIAGARPGESCSSGAADACGQRRGLIPVSSARAVALRLLCLLRQRWELGCDDAGSWHEADGICCPVIRGYSSSPKALVLPCLVVQHKGDFYWAHF